MVGEIGEVGNLISGLSQVLLMSPIVKRICNLLTEVSKLLNGMISFDLR